MTEQEIKEFVSTEFLGKIPDYAIQTVLRKVLYSKKNNIDWEDFYQQIIEQMPELKSKLMPMKFTDLLMEKKPDVYHRLCACSNTKEDLPYLVNIRWMWMQSKGKDKQGFTKEDALISMLEWLDSNSQWQLADLTREEYDELKR